MVIRLDVVNYIYELNPASENIIEQIVSIREYRAINRYSQKNRSAQISGTHHSSPALPKASQSKKGSGHYSTPQEAVNPSVSKSSSEFFDRFYIHDHMKIKSCQAKYKTRHSNQLPTSYNRSDSGISNLEKADIYELNTHQVISLKGIRVNHSA